MGARLRRRTGVDRRHIRSPSYIVVYLGGRLLWELWEEELWLWEEELWLRPRDVDVVFFEDHLELEPRRNGRHRTIQT